MRTAGADPVLTLICRKGDREIRWACTSRAEHVTRKTHFERDGWKIV